jgi:chromosome segregation ATPase
MSINKADHVVEIHHENPKPILKLAELQALVMSLDDELSAAAARNGQLEAEAEASRKGLVVVEAELSAAVLRIGQLELEAEASKTSLVETEARLERATARRLRKSKKRGYVWFLANGPTKILVRPYR